MKIGAPRNSCWKTATSSLNVWRAIVRLQAPRTVIAGLASQTSDAAGRTLSSEKPTSASLPWRSAIAVPPGGTQLA